MATALLAVPIREQAVRPKTLTAVLQDLFIGVYPAEQVFAYQDEYRSKVVRQHKIRLFAAPIILIALSVMGLVIGFVFSQAATVCVGGGFLFAGVDFLTDRRRYWRILTFSWESTEVRVGSLRKLGAPPEVIRAARRIRKRLPGARFELQQLEIDPFLWVKHEGQFYCIGHWDEPGFIDR